MADHAAAAGGLTAQAVVYRPRMDEVIAAPRVGKAAAAQGH